MPPSGRMAIDFYVSCKLVNSMSGKDLAVHYYMKEMLEEIGCTNIHVFKSSGDWYFVGNKSIVVCDKILGGRPVGT